MIFGQGRNGRTGHSGEREMRSEARFRLKSLIWIFAAALVLLPVSAIAMQDSPALRAARPRHAAHAAPQQQNSSAPAVDLEKYKPLIEELSRLEKKIEQNVQIPAPRTQSRILPLVPASSALVAAFPNYGDSLHQVNQIFLDQLKESPVLNDWWQNKAGMVGTM